MDLRPYELTFILPPTLADDEIAEVLERVTGYIVGNQAEDAEDSPNVTKVSHWGRRKLAYQIDTYKEGYYILLEFDGDPKENDNLERRLRLDASILRHMLILKVES